MSITNLNNFRLSAFICFGVLITSITILSLSTYELGNPNTDKLKQLSQSGIVISSISTIISLIVLLSYISRYIHAVSG